MENPNKKDYNVDEQNKIYIIGGKGVGKTSLFHLIFSNKFKEDIKPSNIGIMKSNYKSGEKIFTIKDLTDDDNFTNTNILKNELEDVLLIFILFAFNDKESFEKAKNLILFIKNNLINNKELNMVLLGNKYDLMGSEPSSVHIEEKEIQQYAEGIDNLKYINISCRNNINITQIKDIINNLEIDECKEEDEGVMNEEERKKRVKEIKEKSCLVF